MLALCMDGKALQNSGRAAQPADLRYYVRRKKSTFLKQLRTISLGVWDKSQKQSEASAKSSYIGPPPKFAAL